MDIVQFLTQTQRTKYATSLAICTSVHCLLTLGWGGLQDSIQYIEFVARFCSQTVMFHQQIDISIVTRASNIPALSSSTFLFFLSV